MIEKKKLDKGRIFERLCNIQREFGDAVVFRVGIADDGQVDIMSACNAFTKQGEKPKKAEMEFQLPEVPDYVG